MLQLISTPLALADASLPEIALHADRITLAKRLWRGTAEDGAEFGFELAVPLRNGDVFWQTAAARYVIRQRPEPVVAIPLAELPASAVAGVGWAIGNLHLELSAEADRLLAPDEPAVRQLLERLNVSYQPTTAIFRPGRFVRGAGVSASGAPGAATDGAQPQPASHELGPSHRH